jgi:hypothetical protein
MSYDDAALSGITLEIHQNHKTKQSSHPSEPESAYLHFQMFQDLDEEERHAVLAICIGSLPVEEDGSAVQYCRSESYGASWRDDFVTTFAGNMGIGHKECEQHFIMLRNDYRDNTEDIQQRELILKHHLVVLHNAGFENLRALAYLLVGIVEVKKYDARGSVMLRSIVHDLKLAPSDGVWLLSQFCKFLATQYNRVAQSEGPQRDPYRYAKIGAVAVGAGALVVFTAGLVSLSQRRSRVCADTNSHLCACGYRQLQLWPVPL